MLPEKFANLVGCAKPIQLAGMGGVSEPPLIAAVSNAGGLGMLGAATMPPGFLRDVLGRIGTMTDGVFGVNFLMPFIDTECVPVAARGARVVEFFYDSPDAALVDIVHGNGAIAGWQVGSAEEARQAVDAGCDYIVAQGQEAGGHVRAVGPLADLLAQLSACPVPIVAAGGLGTARHVQAVFAQGASAVRIGTRFLAATESSAHPEYVDALLRASAADTELTEAFSVMWPNAPHRVLRSAIEAAQAFEGEAVATIDIGGQKTPVPPLSVIPPDATARGLIEAMALYAGESVEHVNARQSALEIIAELLGED